MRRIPRPQRAIDPSVPSTSILRAQIPPPSCHRAVASHPLLRTASASFSTTPAFSLLASSNASSKPAKKKHQQFVRRWQKRLLGDSEPIGAHVDPYDPTSPVRIAPEEQGEEFEELLEDGTEGVNLEAVYEEASVGGGLQHVGGPKWVERLEEGNLAKEYEKLTMRTYTPLTRKMADRIEDLTGTMYTLRDDNLMMGQEFEAMTKKPYTNWSFGPATRVRDLPTIRNHFHQAVVEIYALKSAGKNLDVSAAPNRGVYGAPKWIQKVKLQKMGDGSFALAFPREHTVDDILERMEQVPEYSPEQYQAIEEELTIEEDEVIAEEPVPQMDPATPAFKRAAMVTQDPDKKPFDFMSNRPVPRTPPPPPAEPIVETAVPIEEPVAVIEEVVVKDVSPAAQVDIAIETPKSTADSSRSVEHEEAVATLQSKTRDAITALASEKVTRVEVSKTEVQAEAEADAKWRHVPLTDIAIKFALTKRLNQLTGLYISDPNLTSADTLGDLYHHFCAAAKLKPTHLFTQLHVLGQRQAELAKKQQSTQTADALKSVPRQKANLGTLLKLDNVEIHRKRPNVSDERTKKGLKKVIRKELIARELLSNRASKMTRTEKQSRRAVEGTRAAPQFGIPIGPTSAAILRERTERIKRELFEKGAAASNSGDASGLDKQHIDAIIRRRQTVD